MPVADLSGPIYTGMWNNGAPFPDFVLRPVPQPPWVAKRVYCDIFEGLHGQTGTYLETPAHWTGEGAMLDALPAARLYEMPCAVLRLPPADFTVGGRRPITLEQVEAALARVPAVPPGQALLVSTGWGTRWRAPDYCAAAPYFTRAAMERLIALRPFLLGCDSPLWENREAPQNFFADFYAADILLLAPLVGLEELPPRVRLTALPLAIADTCCAPCRAVAVWDNCI